MVTTSSFMSTFPALALLRSSDVLIAASLGSCQGITHSRFPRLRDTSLLWSSGAVIHHVPRILSGSVPAPVESHPLPPRRDSAHRPVHVGTARCRRRGQWPRNASSSHHEPRTALTLASSTSGRPPGS